MQHAVNVEATQAVATAHNKIIMYAGSIHYHHWLHILAGWHTLPLQMIMETLNYIKSCACYTHYREETPTLHLNILIGSVQISVALVNHDKLCS